jgi:DNA-binding IclR family transcriptional regulator
MSRYVGDSVGTVGVLDKAMAIVEALAAGGALSLAGLTEATGMPRATAHRLAVALEGHRLVGRDTSGRFVLGGRFIELGQLSAARQPHLAEVATPVLAQLRDRTGESAQLYVAQGDQRVCLVSLESPHSLRTIVPVGATLTMERGSAGRVLRGDPATLQQGWTESVEEREAGVASVSAPVRVGGAVVAAVSVSGPVERTTRAPGARYAAEVRRAADAIETALR